LASLSVSAPSPLVEIKTPSQHTAVPMEQQLQWLNAAEKRVAEERLIITGALIWGCRRTFSLVVDAAGA